MTMAGFFEAVGAPLKNVRWSWGARRAKDGAVFLRAWKDLSRTDPNGDKWIQIGNERGSRHGWRERQAHLQAIEEGAPCFIVVCEALDESESPRRVASFDQRTVLVGGDMKTEDGKTWIRVVEIRSIWEVR